MLDERIRKAEARNPHFTAQFLDIFAHRSVESSGKRTVLDGNDCPVGSAYPVQHFRIQRFEEAEVIDTHLSRELRGSLKCPCNGRSDGYYGDAASLQKLRGLADRKDFRLRIPPLHSLAFPARVPYYKRAGVVAQGGVHKVAKLRFVGRGAYDAVRNQAVGRKVEGAVVGGTVLANDTGAVKAKHNRQLLKSHIVNYLVIGPLGEG